MGIDSHRWILYSTPWIPDKSYEFQCLSVELGFWIPIVSLILESMSCLPDSKAKDSGFRKKFPGFHNLDSSYIGRNRPFRVPPGLCFKARVGAQPLIWQSFFILMQIKLIFTRKVVHLASF